jgi:hypothetical protein
MSDNAVIALRSWNVLSAHAPLVGQATRLAPGLFDPGPLEYWLLTLPVHADPLNGVLWGAALWCMLACSLTVEAAWAAAGRAGGLLATVMLLGAIAWFPAIALRSCWNPWFGVVFFMAALAAGVATISGRRGWWPVAVIAGSVAAQAHLMFALTSVVLIVLCLAVGLADTRRTGSGYGWAVTGLAAGLVCWSAPLIQQFTSRSGNLAALASGQGASGREAGLGFGLKALAASVQPPAFWWQPAASVVRLSTLDQRTIPTGAEALALGVIVLVIAVYPLRSRRTIALAAVSLTADTAALTYAHIPELSLRTSTGGFGSLLYLLAPMYVAGVLAWITTGTVLVLTFRQVVQRARSHDAVPGTGAAFRALQAGRALRPVLALAAATGVIIGLAVVAGTQVGSVPVSRSRLMNVVGTAVRRIEHDLPRSSFVLLVRSAGHFERRQVTFGLTYALQASGYQPKISSTWWAPQLGAAYSYQGQPLMQVTVLIRHSGLSVRVAKSVMECAGRTCG